MLKRAVPSDLEEYFIGLGKRRTSCVFFLRIYGYNQKIHDFIVRYYQAARKNGVILEGGLKNPDNNNLAYYQEMMGNTFRVEREFIETSLGKWLPRMDLRQRANVAGSIYDTLMGLRKAGKNDNILKNAYIKFMCWLYYRFEQIAHRLGAEDLPKILYEGKFGSYELLLMNVLSLAGCDIVLLEYGGDGEYRKADPSSQYSDAYECEGMEPFPENFSLKKVRSDIEAAYEAERLGGPKPEHVNCTNAWMSGDILKDVCVPPGQRGEDPRFFCNCFCRISGVWDKVTYMNDLFGLQSSLRAGGRKVLILSGPLPPPTPDEIAGIRRNTYRNLTQLISDLVSNIQYAPSQELSRIMRKSFVELMLEEGKKGEEKNLSRLTGKAVYLLCWLRRFGHQLFGSWKYPEIGCLLRMGGCGTDNEALFFRFLSRLPVDVLLFRPEPEKQKCLLADPVLYEQKHELSLAASRYPEANSDVRLGTAAYQAERELDTLLYQDSGMYRAQQFEKANAVNLQIMYEEIFVLWNEELKYRPNFGTSDGTVNMPVIFSKVSGVKDGSLPVYWKMIKKLMTEDTVVITKVPQITPASPNPMKAHATEFFKGGRIRRNVIKQHPSYQYGFLRESMQDYLLEKLQLLIDRKIIRGTFENGTEYTITATALNMEKSLLRLIQKFDFTKKNPKLLYIVTGESVLSLEDAIITAYLNLVGFDIAFFVPTGYQCVEQYFTSRILEEHQAGEYLYDLVLPDFRMITDHVEKPRRSIRERLFGK